MTLTPQGVVENWIVTTLLADSSVNAAVGGRVYSNEIPQTDGESVYPCALIAFLGGLDSPRLSGTRAFTNTRYKVVIVGDGSFADLDNIYVQVDALIQAKTAIISGGRVNSCVREQPFQLTETLADGRKVRQTGGLYLLMIQPL